MDSIANGHEFWVQGPKATIDNREAAGGNTPQINPNSQISINFGFRATIESREAEAVTFKWGSNLWALAPICA